MNRYHSSNVSTKRAGSVRSIPVTLSEVPAWVRFVFACVQESVTVGVCRSLVVGRVFVLVYVSFSYYSSCV